jgi:hypothetical protein
VTRGEYATAIVSYIEPEPGYAREFNRWYEDDHFPHAVLDGPGVVRGERFVATRACKAVRPPGDLWGDPARGSYFAYALVAPDMQYAWDAWVVERMKELTAEGRLFPHREHVNTAVYRWTGGEDGDGANLIVIAGARGPGMQFELERTIIASADPPPHTLSLVRVAGDPIVAFAELDVPADVGFASPFLATVPGTDTYTEDL